MVFQLETLEDGVAFDISTFFPQGDEGVVIAQHAAHQGAQRLRRRADLFLALHLRRILHGADGVIYEMGTYLRFQHLQFRQALLFLPGPDIFRKPLDMGHGPVKGIRGVADLILTGYLHPAAQIAVAHGAHAVHQDIQVSEQRMPENAGSAHG